MNFRYIFLYLTGSKACLKMKRTGSTNALLQKVSSQLKGEIIKKEEDEDDLNVNSFMFSYNFSHKYFFLKYIITY